MDTLSNYLKHLILFFIGGIIYVALEVIWRGYTHWSMFVVGGVAFLLIGGINEYFPWSMPLWKQCGIAMLIVTLLEFISGCILNLWFGLNIWHYTVLEVLGQVSLPFMAVWYFLSAAGIVMDDYLRWKIFGEEKPHYIFILPV